MIIFDNVSDFNTEHIFDCGQCFRWNRRNDGSYDGVTKEGYSIVSFDKGRVYIDGKGDEAFWRDYLALDMDYGKIKEELSDDSILRKAMESGEGIRLLRQDKWETIISFIISQNNNIPRIKGCIEKLSETAGEDIGNGRFLFPSCERLAMLSEEDLAPVRLGYRAKYIEKTSKEIRRLGGEEYLEEIALFGNDELYNALRGLTGIGPKVADCIMLFGFQRYDIFPIDVWVKRLMNRLYGFDEADVNGMKEFSAKAFGEYGGFAQQYLFYHIRKMEKA